jgi:DNA-binding NtrC family response regulator
MRYTPSTGPGRILVVERDPALALFADTILGTWEAFDVRSVSSAQAAAGLLETEAWDLVIADCDLPHAQAGRLLAAVRAQAPGLPFAIITAPRDPAPQALRAADGFITKPMRPGTLIGLATGLIERSRRLREEAAG